MYEVEFSKTAERQFYKLEHPVQSRIAATLERCRIRPHAYAKKLVGSPYFRLRAGEYRLIVDIRPWKLTVFVIEVGHRKNIYK
jgi:mRNA interferase RelE/StbE